MNIKHPATPRTAEQNGVRSPIRNGVINMAWDLFDAAHQRGTELCAAEMPVLAAFTGLNVENLQIELRRWKRFNGIQTGTRPELQAA